mmetsp:Transcript_3456/g.8245  ORF Transcript_3456/g.8245 Transcript_3456/m.8245 type:complete len:83 (+) Transcript_3456:1776-2024(+)
MMLEGGTPILTAAKGKATGRCLCWTVGGRLVLRSCTLTSHDVRGMGGTETLLTPSSMWGVTMPEIDCAKERRGVKLALGPAL